MDTKAQERTPAGVTQAKAHRSDLTHDTAMCWAEVAHPKICPCLQLEKILSFSYTQLIQCRKHLFISLFKTFKLWNYYD